MTAMRQFNPAEAREVDGGFPRAVMAGRAVMPGERKLWVAVLELSIKDYLRMNGDLAYRGAALWFAGLEVDRGTGSFAWVCDLLDLDPDQIMDRLRFDPDGVRGRVRNLRRIGRPLSGGGDDDGDE